MKQKLLFIFALLCMVAQGAWAQRVVNLSTLTDNYVAQDGDVLTGAFPEWEYYISITDGATVTLSNIKLDSSIECLGDATIILADGTENTIFGCEKPGIYGTKKNTTITIKGTGSLYVKGDNYCAGIGGTGCNIVIEDGNITAVGGDGFEGCSGAGIGSGYGYDIMEQIKSLPLEEVGDITISGGTITAKGGPNSAGIGRGYKGVNCGTITINGGTVVAYGGSEGAGIGGCEDMTGGDIFIYGGDITAYGGDYAAGIGGGDGASGGAIWITGGTVKAYGGKDAAGIGGGEVMWTTPSVSTAAP